MIEKLTVEERTLFLKELKKVISPGKLFPKIFYVFLCLYY